MVEKLVTLNVKMVQLGRNHCLFICGKRSSFVQSAYVSRSSTRAALLDGVTETVS